MKNLSYPSKKFVNQGKSIVNQEKNFNISIYSDKKKKLIHLGMPFIFNQEGEIKNIWIMLRLFFGLTRFLVVHFYALGAGYDAKIIDDDCTISYTLT